MPDRQRRARRRAGDRRAPAAPAQQRGRPRAPGHEPGEQRRRPAPRPARAIARCGRRNARARSSSPSLKYVGGPTGAGSIGSRRGRSSRTAASAAATVAAIANGVFQRPGFMVIAWRVMSTPNGATRGGIDLGGTKIQAVVVDAAHVVLGQARHPTPTTGGPAGRRGRDGRGDDGGGERGRRRDRRAGRVSASARPATSTRRPGPSRARATCPTGRASSPSARRLRGGARHAPAPRQRRPGRHRRGVRARRGARPYRSLLGVFWGTGVGGGIVLDGRPWTGPRRGGGDRPRRRAHRRRALPAAGGTAAWRPTPAARRWSAGRARRTRRARRPTCSRSWSSAGARGWRAASGTARSSATIAWRPASSTTPSRRSARASPRPRTSSTSRRSSSAAGSASASATPYAERIAEAMLPHLFDDDQSAGDARRGAGRSRRRDRRRPAGPARVRTPRLIPSSDSAAGPPARGGRRIIGRTRAFPCRSPSSPTSTATATPSRRCSPTSRATDARELWCLGDVVGYGADPNDCCRAGARARRRLPRRQPRPGRHRRRSTSTSSPTAPRSPRAGRRRSSPTTTSTGCASLKPAGRRARRRPLPRVARATRSGSTSSARCWPSCASTPQPERLCLVGHSHVALSFVRPEGEPATGDGAPRRRRGRRRRRRVDPQPGQRRPAARRRPARRLAAARHRRLAAPSGGGREYDIAGAAAAIRAARLPDSLAERLEYGQ